MLETRFEEDKCEFVLEMKELASRGMTAEVVEEVNSLYPDFFEQNPVLLFQLKQVKTYYFAGLLKLSDLLALIFLLLVYFLTSICLCQVQFLNLVNSGDHNTALRVACSHLGPLAAEDSSLLKPLKETLLVLIQPTEEALRRSLPLDALSNSLQVLFCPVDIVGTCIYYILMSRLL